MATIATRNEIETQILTPQASLFLTRMARKFEPRRLELLERRRTRQMEIDAGALPGFLPETAPIRESAWTVAPIPQDLLDRRVEITGPVDRKMIINALNSGASVFMADFEDSNSPTWMNNLEGQANLRDAVDGTISFVSPEGKRYQLNNRVATLLVRPRGWHLDERHFLVDGRPISGSLFDFGLYFFHNAQRLIRKGTGPYFYLPKLESHLEARLWNDVFCFAQDELGIPRGTIRATVLNAVLLLQFRDRAVFLHVGERLVDLSLQRATFLQRNGLAGRDSFSRRQRDLEAHVFRQLLRRIRDDQHRVNAARLQIQCGVVGALITEDILVFHQAGLHQIVDDPFFLNRASLHADLISGCVFG